MDETSIITAITALWGQVVNSPACLLVIVGLNIVAYVLDIWPQFPSKWIPIIMILAGPIAYPLFASRGSVPPEYPHPIAVLIVNGLIAGMAALVAHKQLVQRFLLSKPTDPPPPSDPPSASRLGLFLLCGVLSLGLVGCAGSYDRQVFRLETAALGTADGAMRGYAVYYKSATNNPAAFHRTLADLNTERDRLCALSIQVGASGELVEQLRQSYKTNSALRPALEAGVVTLAANMTNILGAVTNIIHINPH